METAITVLVSLNTKETMGSGGGRYVIINDSQCVHDYHMDNGVKITITIVLFTDMTWCTHEKS